MSKHYKAFWTTEETPTFVYICILKSKRPKIKIGMTWSVKSRVKTLGFGRRIKPVLAGYIKFASEQSARAREKELHKFASKGEYLGDWHEFEPEVVRRFFSDPNVVICGGGQNV